jgi:hypothetical protein
VPQLSESQQRRARQILAKGNVTPDTKEKTGTRSFEAKESTIYYTGPTGQKSVTYTDPETKETYTDYTKPIGPAASGLPDYVPGIAYGYRNLPQHGRDRLGGYYLVTPKAGPNAGRSYILPHSDLGPGAGKGEKLDYNAPATKMVYGSLKEPQGGSYLQYLGKNLPEDVGIGPVAYPPEDLQKKYGLSQAHAEFIEQQQQRRLLAAGPGLRGGRVAAEEAIGGGREQLYTGPEEGAGKGLRLDPGGGTFGGGGATGNLDLIKSRRDQARDALADVNRVLKNQEEARDPRRMQRALERVEPGSEEEWELRRQRSLSAAGPGLSETENVPGQDVWSGRGTLPEPGDIERTIRERGGKTPEKIEESEEYYGKERWYERGRGYEKERFDPYTGERLEGQGQPISYGRELDSAAPIVNSNGKLDVDVNAPRGVVVKAEGEGLFNKTETNRQLEPMAEE